MDKMIFRTSFNLFKLRMAWLFSGAFFIVGGCFMSLHEPTYLPGIINRSLLLKFPELRESCEMIIVTLGNVASIMGLFLVNIGLLKLIDRKGSSLFLGVSDKAIFIPNLLTEAQHTIPISALISVEEIKKRISISYKTEGGQSSKDFSNFCIEDPRGFVFEANQLLLKEKQLRSNCPASSQLKYTVLYERGSKLIDSERVNLSLLSKLLKRSIHEIEKQYIEGQVKIKSALPKDKAEKLKVALLEKYKLEVSIVEGAYEESITSTPFLMPVIAPTFFTIATVSIIPGGLVIWLFLIKYLLNQIDIKMALNQNPFIVAFSVEMFCSLDTSDNEVTALVKFIVLAVTVIYLAFSTKTCLEKVLFVKLNPLLTLLFSIIYINYKTNQIVISKEKSLTIRTI